MPRGKTRQVKPTRGHERARVSHRDARLVSRRDLVMQLHMEGKSLRQIGEALHLSPFTVRNDLAEAMLLTTTHTAEMADRERAQQLLQTQDVLDKLAGYVLPEDESAAPSLAHLDRWLKVQDHRARLTGAYAPQKIAPTDPSGENPYVRVDTAELVELATRAARALAARDGAVSGGDEVSVGDSRPPEPVAAEWRVADVADISGQGVREIENAGGDGPGLD